MFAWFFNLNSRVKLYSLSLLLLLMIVVVAIFGLISNISSANVSSHIDTVLNRSAVRVGALQVAMREFDNNNIEFLTGTKSGSNLESFQQQVERDLKSIVDAVTIMDPERVGDLQTSAKYSNVIKKLKSDMQKLDTAHRTFFRDFSKDIAQVRMDYFNNIRPILAQAYTDCLALSQEQREVVIDLARQGADTRLAYLSLIIAGISVLIGFLLSWSICNNISQSLHKQKYCIEEMSQGNFAFTVPSHAHDDLGEMLEKLDGLRNSLNQALMAVQENSRLTETSLKQVEGLSNSIADSINDCEGKTVSVSAASEEMLSTTQDIAHNCENASSLAQSTNDIITDGVSRIKETISEIKRQSQEMRNNSVAVEQVAKRSLDINSIVNTIEEIAAQTNLLALNAAIEAARAGEAGRGFAVVADEVRALASRTADSTKEIAQMVSNIQSDAALATQSINNSVASMEETSNGTAEVESTMHDMLEHINTVNMQITQIASAAEEQTAATNEIAHHIHDITGLTQHASGEANSSRDIVDETVENIHNLMHSLSYFKLG